MKKLFTSVIVVFALLACSTPQEEKETFIKKGVAVFNKAILDIEAVNNQEQLAEIVEETYKSLDELGIGEEMAFYRKTLGENSIHAVEDSTMTSLYEAFDKFMDAFVEATVRTADDKGDVVN